METLAIAATTVLVIILSIITEKVANSIIRLRTAERRIEELQDKVWHLQQWRAGFLFPPSQNPSSGAPPANS